MVELALNMDFISFKFFFFFIFIYLIYLLLKSNRQKKIFLLAAGYIFYLSWSLKYGWLLLATTVISYLIGRLMFFGGIKKKRLFLISGISYALFVLAVFKYWNFFAHYLNLFNSPLGPINIPYSSLLLPVGISFYTFRVIGFLIDVYRGRIKALPGFQDYALYISFFPQLLSGPIARAEKFFTQLKTNPKVSKNLLWTGIIFIFSGLFKKIVLADNLSPFVNSIFSRPADFHGLVLASGAYAFAVQLYTDFSGYTDIAIGLAMLLGYASPVNFNYPYLAVSPGDFWDRWHISLSSWVRDYLYIPLGGSRRGKLRTYLNLIMVMCLLGLWHGAGWNFVIWGLYQGILLTIHHLFRQVKTAARLRKSKFFRIASVFTMLQLTVFGWILFRSGGLGSTAVYLRNLPVFSDLHSQTAFLKNNLSVIGLVTVFFSWHFSAPFLDLKTKVLKNSFNPWILSCLLAGLFLILVFANGKQVPFLYFRF